MDNTLNTNNFNKRGITVLTIIFMMWGFITVANGKLVKELQDAMSMTKSQERLLEYIFFLVYFVMALPAAWIVEKVGFKKSVFYGLILSAFCSVFMVLAVRELSFTGGYSNSIGTSYYEILTGVIILGCGVTLLQVAANPYVMLLGAKDNEASSLIKTQAFNSIGTWLAPLIGVMVMAYEPHIDVSVGDSLVEIASSEMMDKAERVVLPYILFSVILAGLAIRLNFSSLPEKRIDELTLDVDKGDSIFKYRHVVLGALAIFFYVAAEVAIGSNLPKYIQGLKLTKFEGMEEYLVAYYWGSAMVGRFVGGQLLEGKSASKAVVIASCGALFLFALSLLNTGTLSMTSILFVGLFNSILFPAIFAISVRGMGKLTAKASGLLNMAIIGGAIGSLIVNETLDVFGYYKLIESGEFADYNGFPIIKIAMLIAIPCYLYLIYYGAYGFKNRDRKIAK